MKKQLSIFGLCLFTGLYLNAQNTFPPSGNVGIGTINPNHELTVEGASSPNIELKNSNYSNGGFILNRANYGNQWKWWAQSNTMYFDFATDETNYTNKFTIKSNGNVGIGTTAADAKLHVIHGGSIGNAPIISGNIATFQTNGNNNYYASINVVGGSAGKSSFYFGDKDSGAAGGLRYNNANNSLSFRTNGADDRLFIDNTGNVGIGTTTPIPNFKLTVKGHVNIGGEGNYRLRTRHIDGKSYESSEVSDLYLNYNIGKRVLVGAFHSGSLPSDLLVSGNVGIGTAVPDSKLTVAGKIHAREVKVTINAGADFVFENDYELPSLKEVEQFINTNKHLPEIASEKEMQNNGLYLAEMNIKLLQKIEELTLYTINQEKRIQHLEEENNELKTQKERIRLLEEKLTLLLESKE